MRAQQPGRSRLIIGYSWLAYAAFVASLAWAIAFLADLPAPVTVDSRAGGPLGLALLADGALLLIFAVQHTVMAREPVKRRLTRLVPAAAERSSYVLAASLTLLLLFWQWRGIAGSVWLVGGQLWAGLLWALFAAGWLIAAATTFMVSHRDFLGLRQASWNEAGGPYRSPGFSERWLYRWLRHPLMLGLLIAFWATPRMTGGHLAFAAAGTGYIALGLAFEERDLRQQFGDSYKAYARRVPALVPRPPRSAAPTGSSNAGPELDAGLAE